MSKRKAPSSPSNDTSRRAVAACSGGSDDDGGTDKAKIVDPPPAYGSQEYWEKRYSALKPPGERGQVEGVGEQDDEEANTLGLPGHAWYFTYDELRPLILPLLLGREASVKAFLNESNDEEEVEEEEDGGEVNEEEVVGVSYRNERPVIDVDKAASDQQQSSQEQQQPQTPKSVLEIGCGDVPLGYSLFLDLLSMEKETGADASLVVKQIICNDVAQSVVDVLRDRQKHRWMASGVRGTYKTVDGREGMKTEAVVVDPASLDPSKEHCKGAIVSKLDVSYIKEDARKMGHRDESFDLIIDKGTTDALLSDKDMGIKNCVDVVSEMARILATDGYIMIVSHMNANIPSGLEWCSKVIVAGLRASGANAAWRVEVHGSDGVDASDSDDDEEYDDEIADGDESAAAWDESAAACEGNSNKGTATGSSCDGSGSETKVSSGTGKNADDDSDDIEEEEKEAGEEGVIEKRPPSGSPGPAVYIIHKMKPKTKNADEAQALIPLKFYTY